MKKIRKNVAKKFPEVSLRYLLSIKKLEAGSAREKKQEAIKGKLY